MADHSGHRERLREEFLARPESFPDHKVLELLLFYALPRRDTNPIAHDLIDRFGSLAGVLDADPEAVARVAGMGRQSAVLLQVVKELGRRYQTLRAGLEGIVSDTRAAANVLRPCFYGAKNELVYLLCMDGKGKLLSCPKIGEGSVNAAEVIPRKVVNAALLSNATMVVLAHNHVSGLALPSQEDRATTLYLRDLLAQVGVTLLDHLVFVDDDMVSMADSGFLGPAR